MDKRKKISFSVYTYFFITVLLVVVFFGIMAFVVRDQGNNLKQNIIDDNLKTIHQVLLSTLNQIKRELEEVHQPLAEWDEVRQQLQNPKYYDYWYQNRLITSGILPEFIDNIELFNKNRKILQGNPSAAIQRNFSEKMLGITAYLRDSDIVIGYGFPVIGGTENNIQGYFYLETKLKHALNFQHTLTTEQAAKIRHNLTRNEIIPYEELINRLIIPVAETPESIELTRLIETVQKNLFLIGGVISIFVWLLIVNLFAKPILGLSNLIDRLRNNTETNHGRELSYFQVTEIEKTRRSLTQFHDQLQLRNNELINSEKQLRTILDNVPDGVISIVGNDIIFSCNPAAGKLFNISVKNMKGKHLSEFVNLNNDDELYGVRSDGSRFPAEMTFSEIISESDTRIVIVRDISERKNAEEKLIQLANFDPLTGLPNRTLMRDRLDHAIKIAGRNHSQIGLMFLDLDSFKKFNDTLGHQIGDQLLTEVASRLERTVRQSDTVARLGGDEFTVILENISHTDELTEIASNILKVISEPMQLAGREVNFSTSIGITIYPSDDRDPERLIKNADTAMYRAKELGGNNYQFFTEDLNIKAMQHLELENQLRHALQNSEFILHFQPKLNMQTEEIIGAEALVRWQKSPDELIMPGTFIANAEDTGLIIPLGSWIFEQACKHIKFWQEQNLQVPRISINISPRQFNEMNFLEMVEDVLQRTGVPPRLLEFEITEGMIMENSDRVVHTLKKLRQIGIAISLDDFGTGYSSLSYLKQLPIDIIKIDRSFVSDIPYSEDACSIVNAIIALSVGLKRNVIAEGIETDAQSAYLRSAGCLDGQGYLYSQPIPADEFARKLTLLPDSGNPKKPGNLHIVKG